MVRALILAAALACAPAAEWTVDLPVPGEVAVALPADALADADAVRIAVSAWRADPDRPAWLEPALETADGRRYVAAQALPLEEGDAPIALAPSAWVGERAPLGGDALVVVRRLVLRAYGGAGEGDRARIRISTDPARRGTPRFALQALGGGLVRRGAWRELRLRLIGDLRGERGELDLVAGDGRRVPCFLEQPGEVDAGIWRAVGPCRWVARLRDDEDLAGWRVEWRDGAQSWRGPALPALADAAAEPAPAAVAPPFPFPLSPAWRGRAVVVAGEGRFARADERDHDACPAPILAWLAGWTGFRGANACAHPQAAALDALCAAGVAELDLLPQALFAEQGAFRFGLAPWHAAQGGPWREPQDALAHDAPLASLRAHARWVVARARAAPVLARWRLGFVQPANAPAEVERLRSLVGDVAALIAACDGRPLAAFHPQAVDYGYVEPKGTWFDFEADAQGWRVGLAPPGVGLAGEPQAPGSDGARSLAIPLDLAGRVGGGFTAPDAAMFNLDRLEFDALLDGGGAATVYAWCTDAQHRWYQQRLGDVAANGRWQTMGVDFSDGAAWQPCGHQAAWDGGQRRRLRLLGVAAFAYDPGSAAPGAEAASGPAEAVRTLRIDRVRRLGWPALAIEPTLAIQTTATITDAARWRPIGEDFALSVAAANPYDPEQADVAADIEGPDGRRTTHPAYWWEPQRLEMVDGAERAVPDGPGAWRWRFTPPQAGAWRWRIVARVRWRDRWLDAVGPWRDATVRADADGAPAPVRRGAGDPRWFETVDGAFWYPVGLNLRSPGDSRQDNVVGQVPRPAGRPVGTAEFTRLGTRAYERWFERLAANGGDFARVWMSPWWCGLEWRRDWDGFGGVGWYNQSAAACLDRVLELATARGIRLQLELQNHGMFSTRVDQQWEDNPYSRRRGGMCDTAADFFSRDDAWDAHAKRLRYVLARWGHSTAAAMWVLTSEVEWTDAWFREAQHDEDRGHSATVEAWLRKSAQWFSEHDVLARPVSVHFSHPWRGARIWQMPEMQWGYSNAYTGFQEMNRLGGRGGLDQVLDFYVSRHFPPWTHRRPALIGEWGGHWEHNTHAGLAAQWHAGLWMQAVLPYAGNTGFWWWLWVDAADGWGEMAGPARFARSGDPRGADWRSARPRAPRPDLGIVGMSSADEHRYYAFARGSDRDPDRRNSGDAGVVVLTGGIGNATWRVQRWDCATGQPVGESAVVADAEGRIHLPLGEIARDAAFILRRER